MITTEFVEESWKHNTRFQSTSSDVVFGPDNNLVAGYYGFAGRQKGIIRIWDLKSRRRVCKNSVSLSSSASCLDISNDGE